MLSPGDCDLEGLCIGLLFTTIHLERPLLQMFDFNLVVMSLSSSFDPFKTQRCMRADSRFHLNENMKSGM